MSSASEEELWVICPVCHKANPAGTRYCEYCWGAVIHPDVPMTSEEVEEAQRRRQAYLKRQRIIKSITVGLGSLAVLFIIYIILYYSSDIVSRPPQEVNSNSLPGEWAMFRYDLNHSGSSGSIDTLPEGKQKWAFSTGAAIHSSPAVADGIVYVGSQDSVLYALNADTGAKNWEFVTSSWVESSPSVANDTVYFGSNDSRLYALDAKTGDKFWEFKTAFPVKSAPAIAGDSIYFGSDDYFLYALDAETGKKRWDYNVGGPVWSAPVVSNGIVHIGSSAGYSYALNTINGQRRLRFKSHYAIYGSPVINDDVVYVVTTNGVLYAFDGGARTRWREHEIRPFWMQMYVMGVPGVPKPPVQSGFLWFLKLSDAATSSPVISGNKLYIGLNTKLIAVDLENRKELWEFETKETIRSSPAVIDSTIYVGSEDGRLYAVDTASGEELWHFQTGSKITSSPAVVDGIVYVGSHDGNLYAIE